MIELKRYTIMSSAKGPNRDIIEDPNGQWIFDPGHKIKLGNNQSNGPDEACSHQEHVCARCGVLVKRSK